MSTIRRNAALSVMMGIAAVLILAAASASSLSAARVSAAAPAIGEPQVGAADTTCAEAAVDQSTAGKPCKTCSDKPYCKCTYNGQPRISCDPCCYYGTYAGEICLD